MLAVENKIKIRKQKTREEKSVAHPLSPEIITRKKVFMDLVWYLSPIFKGQSSFFLKDAGKG